MAENVDEQERFARLGLFIGLEPGADLFEEEFVVLIIAASETKSAIITWYLAQRRLLTFMCSNISMDRIRSKLDEICEVSDKSDMGVYSEQLTHLRSPAKS